MGKKLAAILIILAAIVVIVGCDGHMSANGPRQEPVLHSVPPESLAAAREKQPTVHKPTDYQPSGPFQLPSMKAYLPVKYPSKVGPLAAYLTRDPGDGKKHPVVVWAHGGFGGIDPSDILHQPAPNDQSPDSFREAGFVVMFPSWRGENDNPGKFEMFAGEVDDLLSAIAYARKLPYVDPDRVYLLGHSSGGTLVLLAAELGAPVRLAISLGGTADITQEIALRKGGFYHYKQVPFDWQNPQEMAMRCAANFVADIRIPTWYIEGQLVGTNVQSARVMAALAVAYQVPLHVHFIAGADHFTPLRSTKRLLAEKLKADTGPKLRFSLTDAELNEAFFKRRDAKPQVIDKPFATITPVAAATIKKAFTELQSRFPTMTFFVRVYLSPDDDPVAEYDLSYDIDDAQCRVSEIPVVIDRRSLDNLRHVVIGLAHGKQNWLTADRVEAIK